MCEYCVPGRALGQLDANTGLHRLAAAATDAYEDARATVCRFLNAGDPREVIFVRGATEAINLVAHTYGRVHVGKDDEILVSAMEHHSNIVPWQILCEEKKAVLKVIPVNDRGELLMEEYEKSLIDLDKLLEININDNGN